MSRRTRFDWFSSLTGPQRSSRAGQFSWLRYARRLRLEPLEDRRLLSITVNTLADTIDLTDGVTSLREAIFAANTVPGADTIEFAASLTNSGQATILLTQGELKITDSLAVNGPGENLLTIDASGNDPTPDVNDGKGSRIFNVDDGNSGNFLNASISGLTLTGGDVPSLSYVPNFSVNGGAIRSTENLAVIDCVITGNSASGTPHGGYTRVGAGGGIYSRGGNLSVTGSTIIGNVARHTAYGGGIFCALSACTVTSSTISNNSADAHGGGIMAGYGSLLTVIDSTITGNSAGFGGGGINSTSGNLTVTGSTIKGNSAGSEGGGIAINGNLTVTASTITGNTASFFGGGITSSGTLTVTASTITGNTASFFGGGIRSSGTLTVTGSTISNNSAGGTTLNAGGGGIWGDIITVTSCIISGNSASLDGGGIRAVNLLTVTGSTISGNSATRNGGGIYGFLDATITVTGSTISTNKATAGGGALFSRGGGSTTVANSTISGNSAGGSGGGLYLFGTGGAGFTVRHSTITVNTAAGVGGGIFLVAGPLALDHTILAANTGLLGPDLADPANLLVAASFNLIGTNVGSPLVEAPVGAPDANGNLIGGPVQGTINPLLGPLANNGGPTLTHMLLEGSPAIDSGDPSAAAGVGTVPLRDQRGAPFVRVFDGDAAGGARIDIGAYERQTLPALNLVVDTLTDVTDGDYSAGELSLREAIGLANGSVLSLDTIAFAAALTAGGPATITLTHGELAITDSLTINGPGANLLTIDASANDPTPDSTLDDGNTANDGDGSRIFNIDDGNSSTQINGSIAGLMLTGGDVKGDGGAIRSRENLSVLGSTISGNLTGVNSNYEGGGIYSYGSLTVTASTISGNSSRGDGGGIRMGFSGSLVVTDSTLSGNTAKVDGGAISSSSTSVTVTRSALSGNVANGSGGSRGGAIWMSGGSLIVTDSTINNNSAFGFGGGIWKSGSLTVSGSTITGNRANADNIGSGSGGGIYGGTVVVTGSTISGNSATYGGGISGGAVTVSGSTISGNSATRNGSGINSTSGNLTVTSSTIKGNSGAFGGGISKTGSGNVALTSSTISGNSASSDGGGIRHNGTGALTVTDSTLSSNSAGRDGGGVHKIGAGTVLFTNSTISGNTASRDGGGFWTSSSFIVSTSTVAGNSAGNSGGGLFETSVMTLVTHTIVANNTSGAVPTANDIAGSVTLFYSLLGVSTGATITDNGGNLVGTAAAPIDPLLGPLADYGGPTMTHALLPGSPALDAGNPAAMAGIANVPEFDQRGTPFSRVRDGNGVDGPRIDIGAFESQNVPTFGPGDYNKNGIVDAADYSVYQDTLGSTIDMRADGSGNGVVDAADYNVWKSHFGQTLPPQGAGAFEPASDPNVCSSAIG